MINVLIPMSGKSEFFDSYEYKFPKPLIEINGKLMIELVIENFSSIKEEKKFIFIVKKVDCYRYHLDNVLNLLTNKKCQIIQLSDDTKGAACSALLAIKYINNESGLIIANGDQVIDQDINDVLEFFKKRDLDAGVICFEGVHPKWSYVKIEKNEKVTEVTEKKPISKNAIAGFYYFKKGSYFVASAMRSIEKDANVDGQYYIAPTLNEMILDNRNLGVFKIKSNQYNSFYSPQKIKEYEKKNI